MIITYQNKVTRYYCDYFESFYMFANLYWKGKARKLGWASDSISTKEVS